MINKVLGDLISINTQNPGGDSSKIIDYILKIIVDKKLSYKIYSPKIDKRNLIVRVNGASEKTVVINGHIDTKPLGNIQKWDTNPFIPCKVKNRLYGLGASDMKGGIATMVTLLKGIVEEKIAPKYNLEFHFVDDEENNSGYGIKWLLSNKVLMGNYDFVIVCEPTENNLVTSSLGNTWKKIEFFGKMAHAGHYFEGINSNELMVNFIYDIKKKVARLQGIDPEFAMFPNINMGIIYGGDHPGTVPDYSYSVIDIRVSKEEHKNIIVGYIEEYIQKNHINANITDYLPPMKSWKYSMNNTEFSDLLIKDIVNIYKKISRKEIKFNKFYGGTDAGEYFDVFGSPVCILGPGSLKEAHQPNEWIDLRQVEIHYKIMEELLFYRCYETN